MVLRHALLAVLIGLGLGVATALGLGRFLSGLLFQVTPADPTILCSVVAVTIGAAAAACLLPVRATRTAPIDALRSE
jgi:ABC-type antimicrobial peptide transport system permease subunit